MTVPGAIFTKNQDPTGYALWLSVASFPGSSPAFQLHNVSYIMRPKSWEGDREQGQLSVQFHVNHGVNYNGDVMYSVGTQESGGMKLAIVYDSHFIYL